MVKYATLDTIAMVLNFDALVAKYDMKIRGVIHVGAHIGQEYELYKKHGITNIMFVEPQPDVFNILQQSVGPECICVNKAFGLTWGKHIMFVDDFSRQSSSLMNPKHHLKQYPHITFNSTIEVDMVPMDFMVNGQDKYNLLVMDVQGYEENVILGGPQTMQHIDYIISEVNSDELYEGCAQVIDLDRTLELIGFKRVETNWIGETWGDALYVRM